MEQLPEQEIRRLLPISLDLTRTLREENVALQVRLTELETENENLKRRLQELELTEGSTGEGEARKRLNTSAQLKSIQDNKPHTKRPLNSKPDLLEQAPETSAAKKQKKSHTEKPKPQLKKQTKANTSSKARELFGDVQMFLDSDSDEENGPEVVTRSQETTSTANFSAYDLPLETPGTHNVERIEDDETYVGQFGVSLPKQIPSLLTPREISLRFRMEDPHVDAFETTGQNFDTQIRGPSSAPPLNEETEQAFISNDNENEKLRIIEPKSHRQPHKYFCEILDQLRDENIEAVAKKLGHNSALFHQEPHALISAMISGIQSDTETIAEKFSENIIAHYAQHAEMEDSVKVVSDSLIGHSQIIDVTAAMMAKARRFLKLLQCLSVRTIKGARFYDEVISKIQLLVQQQCGCAGSFLQADPRVDETKHDTYEDNYEEVEGETAPDQLAVDIITTQQVGERLAEAAAADLSEVNSSNSARPPTKGLKELFAELSDSDSSLDDGVEDETAPYQLAADIIATQQVDEQLAGAGAAEFSEVNSSNSARPQAKGLKELFAELSDSDSDSSIEDESGGSVHNLPATDSKEHTSVKQLVLSEQFATEIFNYDDDDGSQEEEQQDKSEEISGLVKASIANKKLDAPASRKHLFKNNAQTVRKERNEWRITSLAVFVTLLCRYHPIEVEYDRFLAYFIDTTRHTPPTRLSGYLLGLGLAWPEALGSALMEDLEERNLNSTRDVDDCSTDVPTLGSCILQVVAKKCSALTSNFRLLNVSQSYRFSSALSLAKVPIHQATAKSSHTVDDFMLTTFTKALEKVLSTVLVGPEANRVSIHDIFCLDRSDPTAMSQVLKWFSIGGGEDPKACSVFNLLNVIRFTARSIGLLTSLRISFLLGIFEKARIGQYVEEMLHSRVSLVDIKRYGLLLPLMCPRDRCVPSNQRVPYATELEQGIFLDFLNAQTLYLNSNLDFSTTVRAVQIFLALITAWDDMDASCSRGTQSKLTGRNASNTDTSANVDFGVDIPLSDVERLSYEDQRFGPTVVCVPMHPTLDDPIPTNEHDLVLYRAKEGELSLLLHPILMRLRCVARAIARGVLLACVDVTHKYFTLQVEAARYLLYEDPHGSVTDEIVTSVRMWCQGKVDAVPQDILRFIARLHGCTVRANVINLRRRSDRFQRVIGIARKVGLVIRRIEACDGSLSGCVVSEKDVSLKWDTFLNSRFDRKTVAAAAVSMSTTERACAASHLSIWREIIQSTAAAHPASLTVGGDMDGVSHGDIFLIMEDDVLIRQPSFRKLMGDILRELPSNFDICFLGHVIPKQAKVFHYTSKLLVPEYLWHLHCYLLSAQGAKKLCSHLPICGPVDNHIATLGRNGVLNVFAAKYPLAWQDKSGPSHSARSSIDSNITHSGRITDVSRHDAA